MIDLTTIFDDNYHIGVSYILVDFELLYVFNATTLIVASFLELFFSWYQKSFSLGIKIMFG